MADPAPAQIVTTIATKGGNSDVWIVVDAFGQGWCLQCAGPGGQATVIANREGMADHVQGEHLNRGQRVQQRTITDLNKIILRAGG